MDHKEIFQELTKCKIKGMMFHSNMADYYAFFDCCTLRSKHEKELKCDMKAMRCIKDYYYMNNDDTLLTNHGNLAVDDFLSEDWHKTDFSDEERLERIELGLNEYYNWEVKVKEKLEIILNELFSQDYFDDYKFVKEFFDKVIVEISHVRDAQTFLAQRDFNSDTEEYLNYKL